MVTVASLDISPLLSFTVYLRVSSPAVSLAVYRIMPLSSAAEPRTGSSIISSVLPSIALWSSVSLARTSMWMLPIVAPVTGPSSTATGALFSSTILPLPPLLPLFPQPPDKITTVMSSNSLLYNCITIYFLIKNGVFGFFHLNHN